MQKNTPYLLRIFRLISLLLHIISGLLQSIVYPFFSLRIQRNMMQRWANGLLSILSIKLKCYGTLPNPEVSPTLLVANHISWLDICILMAACPTRFVAKSEISQWPILGLLCRNAGTLFIERTKRSDTRRINQKISEVLKRGECVTVFPEGTTTDGTKIKHFHASLLQSAVAANTLLYPIAIRYCNFSDEICLEAAYIEPSLVLSLQKILSQPSITTKLTFNQPITCDTKNRRELARLSEKAIAETLSVPIVHNEAETASDRANE